MTRAELRARLTWAGVALAFLAGATVGALAAPTEIRSSVFWCDGTEPVETHRYRFLGR